MTQISFNLDNVFFSNSRTTLPSGDTWAVVLPTDTNWNDHNVETYYDLIIKFQGTKLSEEKRFTKILFYNESQGLSYIKSLPDLSPISIIQNQFISQFQSSERFIDVINLIGKKNFISLLMCINDGSILKAIKKPFPSDLVDSTNYQVSLLRERDAYLAFYNGPGALLNSFNDSASGMTYEYIIPNQPGPTKIDISFNTPNNFFKHRILTFVGKNGSGKSQTLNAIINSVLNEEILETCSPAWNRILVLTNTKDDPYPKYFDEGDFRNIFYLHVNLLEEKVSNTLSQSFAQIMRDNIHYNNKSKSDIFFESISQIVDCEDIWIPMRYSSGLGGHLRIGDIPYSSFKTNFLPLRKEKDRIELIKAIDIYAEIHFIKNNMPVVLSTGQKFFTTILIRLMSLVEKGTLILFDEPETFLHPNLEVELIDYLYTLTEQLQSYAIISTHSVYITREMPREQVRIFNIEEGVTRSTVPEIQTLGANLTTISNYIFGDISIRKSFQKKLDILLKTYGDVEKIILEHETELSDRAILYLRNSSHEKS